MTFTVGLALLVGYFLGYVSGATRKAVADRLRGAETAVTVEQRHRIEGNTRV